jgi:DNA-binding MarR family transcriptional regulator
MKLWSEPLERAWIALVRGPTAALADVQSALKSQDLPALEWYDVLLELSREPDGGLRQKELSRRLLVARYNLSRLLDRLESEGLVRREPCADDARGAVVRLTDAGRSLRERMAPAYAAAVAERVGTRLSEAEQETLAALLRKLL